MPGSNLLELRNSGDVHIGLGVRFPSSTEYNHLFGAHDLCGTRSTWLCLFLLDSSSSEMATLRTSRVTPRIGLGTPRLSRGVNCMPRWVPRLQLWLGWTQVVPDVTSSLWRSISVFFVLPWGSIYVSSSSKASVQLFLILAFLLWCGRAPSLRYDGLLSVDVFF